MQSSQVTKTRELKTHNAQIARHQLYERNKKRIQLLEEQFTSRCCGLSKSRKPMKLHIRKIAEPIIRLKPVEEFVHVDVEWLETPLLTAEKVVTGEQFNVNDDSSTCEGVQTRKVRVDYAAMHSPASCSDNEDKNKNELNTPITEPHMKVNTINIADLDKKLLTEQGELIENPLRKGLTSNSDNSPKSNNQGSEQMSQVRDSLSESHSDSATDPYGLTSTSESSFDSTNPKLMIDMETGAEVSLMSDIVNNSEQEMIFPSEINTQTSASVSPNLEHETVTMQESQNEVTIMINTAKSSDQDIVKTDQVDSNTTAKTRKKRSYHKIWPKCIQERNASHQILDKLRIKILTP